MKYMKNLNADAFKQSNKKNQTLIIVGIFLFAITVLLIYLGIKNHNKPLPTPENLRNIVENEETKENQYAYLDVAIKPFLFAVYKTDGKEEAAKYYLVMDKKNNLYILYMNDDKYKSLNVDSIINNPIRVYGITKRISNELEEFAISSYNEIMEQEYLNKDNFKDNIGLLYLDINSEINDSSLYYLGACLTGLFSFIIITTYIVILIKNNKLLKIFSNEEIAKIDSEISQMENSQYANMKFYLLKDYVVDLVNNVVILKYLDIIWAYQHEQRYNGLLINKCIRLVDKKNKVYDIANTKFLDKNKDEILKRILGDLQKNNPELIIGFTKENKKIVKEKIKELKNKNN